MAFRALRRATTLAVAILAATSLAAPAYAADDTGAISGRLTTSTGQPVAMASVEAFDFETNNSGFAFTADDGSYTVDNLPPGGYTVRFFAADHPAQYFDNTVNSWEAERVAVTAGATTTVDEDLNATGTLSGHLLAADGTPLRFAQVEIYDENGGWISQAETDDTAGFSVSVVPGAYRVAFRPVQGSEQSQWVPGALDQTTGTLFTVGADQTVEVTDTALPTGSISGRLTTPAGTAAGNVAVSVYTTSGDDAGLAARTDSTGRYAIGQLLVGTYLVGFATSEFGVIQYHRGTFTAADADPVAVTAGAATVVNERQLANGTLRMTAVDSHTGAPIQRFCVTTCTTTGSIEIADLTPGKHEFSVTTPGGSYFARTISPNVRAGQTTELTVKLGPAAQIKATVVDAATGKPLSGVCLTAYKPKTVRLADGFAACSSFLGTVTLGELTNGNYRLLAKPQSANYGMQWVGATGGTGDERQAVVIPATLGTVAAAPEIRIDRTGSIAGTVTDAETGAPIANARVAPFSQQPGQGAPETLTDEDGRYQVDGLGPYAWPLKFAAIGSAQAWTGGAATRYTATPTQVTAGATATADLALRDGVEVVGPVRTESGAAITGFVSVRNADTGDYAGSDDVSDGRFSVRVLPGTRIYFSYTLSQDGVSHNVDRVPGDIVRVPATGLTAEIVVPGA